MDAEIKGQIDSAFRRGMDAIAEDDVDKYRDQVQILRELINDLDDIQLSMYAHKGLELLTDVCSYIDRDWK